MKINEMIMQALKIKSNEMTAVMAADQLGLSVEEVNNICRDNKDKETCSHWRTATIEHESLLCPLDVKSWVIIDANAFEWWVLKKQVTPQTQYQKHIFLPKNKP